MTDEPTGFRPPADGGSVPPGLPAVADRATFQAQLDALRVRE